MSPVWAELGVPRSSLFREGGVVGGCGHEGRRECPHDADPERAASSGPGTAVGDGLGGSPARLRLRRGHTRLLVLPRGRRCRGAVRGVGRVGHERAAPGLAVRRHRARGTVRRRDSRPPHVPRRARGALPVGRRAAAQLAGRPVGLAGPGCRVCRLWGGSGARPNRLAVGALARPDATRARPGRARGPTGVPGDTPHPL